MTFFCCCIWFVDIYVGMAKKKSKSTYKPYILPSEFSAMDSFIEKNKTLMTEQVVASIEYAVQQKLEIVEVFKFKSSDFVITLSQDSFKQNLQNVYEYYIATEKYELCARVKELEFQLNIISYQVNLHEKK